MHEQEFQIGDVVFLKAEEDKAQKTAMMIKDVRDYVAKKDGYFQCYNEYDCIYFDANKVLRDVSLPEHCLMRYNKE